MKKLILFAAFILNVSICSAQSCEQKLEQVITGFNNFKNCSQRAEMNALLQKSTEVIKDCPVLYAQNQERFLKAKKYVEDTYLKLGCSKSNNSTGANSIDIEEVNNAQNYIDKSAITDKSKTALRTIENERYNVLIRDMQTVISNLQSTSKIFQEALGIEKRL